uniref:Uncharacterized protein n=1 Tax=Anguilla anguilla TaxID=7936 RepID=A0A0E9RW15_ANGAN
MYTSNYYVSMVVNFIS